MRQGLIRGGEVSPSQTKERGYVSGGCGLISKNEAVDRTVILSEAKDLLEIPEGSFASLRMTIT